MKLDLTWSNSITLPKSPVVSLLLLVLLQALAASGAPAVHAATTITVDSTADTTANDGHCTLREAIINVNTSAATWPSCAAGSSTGMDVINITATGTITLTNPLTLTESVTIVGPGASNLTISGANTHRVFHVWMGGETFSFQHLTIADGSAGSGGGIGIDGALAVSVNDVVFSGNTSTSSGGAIYNGSGYPLTVTNSTFVNNTGGGGAISNDGPSTLIVANSTFSGNRGGSKSGGTILQIGSGSTALTNITISSNDANSAIFIGGGTLTLRNSIVVNDGGASCQVGGGLTLTDGGNNIDSGTSCGFSAPGSVSGTDPKLGSLANNGGPTETMALLAGSPAINAGNAAVCSAAIGSPTYGAGGEDQRGLSRRDGFCDIGAFEAQPASLGTTAGSSPQSTLVNASFSHSLGVNVTDAHSNALGGATVTYAVPSSGASAVLSATTANTDASGNASVTATANSLAGSYSVTASATGASPATFNLTNTPGSTTTTIASHLPDSSQVGEAVTVAYTVTSPYGTPTGNVTVSSGTLSCTATVAAGSCTLTFPTPGSKTITAAYAGQGSFGASTSPSVTHSVVAASTSTSITSHLPDSSRIGQPVTIAFTVSSLYGTPTGSVTVGDGSVNCTDTVATGHCALTFVTPGTKTLTAAYAGDGNFGASTSPSVMHTVLNWGLYLPLTIR